ncbi:hypothetical protein GCWU000246_00206 [Jonquetella anthropi E3_33 E1]|nr:hypothetical protein GCWU000246_00206 [Jonquetella anthropi E3_33 E1]
MTADHSQPSQFFSSVLCYHERKPSSQTKKEKTPLLRVPNSRAIIPHVRRS